MRGFLERLGKQDLTGCRVPQGQDVFGLVGGQPGGVSQNEGVQFGRGVQVLGRQDAVHHFVAGDFLEEIHRVRDGYFALEQNQLSL